MKPSKDGTTTKQHLEQVQKQTGRKLEQLEGPEFPTCMSYVWSVFLDLNNSRSMGEAGAQPITYQDIKAYTDLTHTALSPRDVNTIKLVDREYLSIMNASEKKKT